MTTNYLDIRIASPRAVDAWVSGDQKGSMRRFINYLEGLLAGTTFHTDSTTIIAETAGVRASNTVTFASSATGCTAVINGVTFTGGQYRARVKATLVSAVAGNTITVAGTTFTGATGAVVLGAATFSVDTGDTEAAASLAAQINGHATAGLAVKATSAAGVVTMGALALGEGTAGNALTITKSGAPITLNAIGGGADTGVFQGGAAAGTNTFDSIAAGSSDTAVAASLAASVVRSATANIVNVVTATSATTVTTITAIDPGLEGNSITLTAAGTGPTAGGARLTGGTSTLITTTW